MEAKAALRRAIKERLWRMTENDRRVESKIIMRELRKLITDAPRTIGAFIPFLDEPDLRPLLLEWMESGWIVCIPAVENGGLVFRKAVTLDIPRHPVTNIPHPEGEPMQGEDIDIVIVPGRAFTKDGMRLGRGNGGYDRWLAANPEPKTIGICFDCQMLQDMPQEPHDRPVQTVLTPSKIYGELSCPA